MKLASLSDFYDRNWGNNLISMHQAFLMITIREGLFLGLALYTKQSLGGLHLSVVGGEVIQDKRRSVERALAGQGSKSRSTMGDPTQKCF